MIQLVAFAAIGAVGYVAYSSFKKHMAEIKKEEAKKAAEKEIIGSLEKDPKTGKYRPKK